MNRTIGSTVSFGTRGREEMSTEEDFKVAEWNQTKAGMTEGMELLTASGSRSSLVISMQILRIRNSEL